MKKLVLIIFLLLLFPYNAFASIKGDVTGNGIVNTEDYIKVKKHILKMELLKGDMLKRADVYEDGKISTLDYVRIVNIMLGKYKEVKEVKLNKNTLSLEVGKSETLKATITPSDATNKDVTWKSSDKNIVTVSSNGAVKGIKEGKAIITVMTNDGNKKTTCSVTIIKAKPSEVKVTGVKLDKTSITLSKGKTQTLLATINPNNATNKDVAWKSSDTKVATVNQKGKITAVNPGTATITVTTKDGSKKASCKVAVVEQYLGWNQKDADKKFGPILEGLFTGKTKETIVNTKIGKKISMHFADMAYVNGVIYAYYICSSGYPNRHATCLATSVDGIKFEDKGRVIMPDADYDYSRASFAGVWHENNTFYLVYEALGKTGRENIALATSKDGINWEKKGIILYKNEKLNWQTGNIGTPDLYKVKDTWYLTFHGFNRDDCQIGIAYGTDLYNLKVKETPIIPTKDNTLYSGTTGRRDIIYINGWYYMVYEVSTDKSNVGYKTANWSHMFARSKDMLNWETMSNPLLIQKDASGNPITGFGYDGPCWVIMNDHIYVYFRETVDGQNWTTRAELTLK